MAKYFTPATDPVLFACPCKQCPPDFQVKPTARLLAALDDLRAIYGRPIRVSSGVRCPAYNAKVGGASGSEHTTGDGADLAVPSSPDRFDMLEKIFQVGIKRVGVGRGFLHVGTSPTLVSHVCWVYNA